MNKSSGGYCVECGAEILAGASFCEQCGNEVTAPATPREERVDRTGPDTTTTTPKWTLAALAGCWAVWIAGIAIQGETLALVGIGVGGVAPGLAGVALVGSLPILWIDAHRAKRANQLVSRPIFIVLAAVLLWAVTLPAYVLYRAVKQIEGHAPAY